MSAILEFLRRTYVERTPHMLDAGIRITDLSPSRGAMLLPADPRWLGDPERGLMHPGPVTVLADSCCGLAVGAALAEDISYATLDLRMDYLRRAVPDKSVHCEAHCYRVSRSVAFIRAEVWQDDQAAPIASAQASFMLATPAGSRPASPDGGTAPLAPETFMSAASAAMAALTSAKDGQRAATASAETGGWTPPAASEPVSPEQPIGYLAYLGVRMAPDPAQPVFRLPFKPEFIGNPYLPALHGGVVAGFAETAAILHLSQTLGGAKLPRSIDFSLDYLRAGRPEECFASCELARLGSRVALVTVRVWQRSPDYPIVVARVHCLLTPRD